MEHLVISIVDRRTFLLLDKCYCYNYSLTNDMASVESSTFILDITDDTVFEYQNMNTLKNGNLIIADFPPSPFSQYASSLYLGVIRSYDNNKTIECDHFYKLFDEQIPLQNGNISIPYTPRMVKEWMQLCLHGVLYQVSSYTSSTGQIVWKFPYNAKYLPVNKDIRDDLNAKYDDKYFNIIGEDNINKLEKNYNFQIQSLSLNSLVDKIKQGLEDYHDIINVEINDLLSDILKTIDTITNNGFLVSTPTLLTPSLIESFEETDYETFYRTYYEVHDIQSSNHVENITFNYGKQSDSDIVTESFSEPKNNYNINAYEEYGDYLNKIVNQYDCEEIYPYVLVFNVKDMIKIPNENDLNNFPGILIDTNADKNLYKLASTDFFAMSDAKFSGEFNIRSKSSSIVNGIPFKNSYYYNDNIGYYYDGYRFYRKNDEKYEYYKDSNIIISDNFGISIITSFDDLRELLKYISIDNLYTPMYDTNNEIELNRLPIGGEGLYANSLKYFTFFTYLFTFPIVYDDGKCMFCIENNNLYTLKTPPFWKPNIQYFCQYYSPEGSDTKVQNLDYNTPLKFNSFSNINDVTVDSIKNIITNKLSNNKLSYSIFDWRTYTKHYDISYEDAYKILLNSYYDNGYDHFISLIVKLIKFYFTKYPNITSYTYNTINKKVSYYKHEFDGSSSYSDYTKIYTYNNTHAWKLLISSFDVGLFLEYFNYFQNTINVLSDRSFSKKYIDKITSSNINNFIFNIIYSGSYQYFINNTLDDILSYKNIYTSGYYVNYKYRSGKFTYRRELNIDLYKKTNIFNQYCLKMHLATAFDENHLPTTNPIYLDVTYQMGTDSKNSFSMLLPPYSTENTLKFLYLPVKYKNDVGYYYRNFSNYKIYEKDGTTQFYISDGWSFIKNIDVDDAEESYNACFFYTTVAALNNATTLSRVYLCLDNNELDELGNPTKKLWQVDTRTPASADLSIPPTTNNFPESYTIELPLKVKHCILSPTGSNTTSTLAEEMAQAQVELATTNDSDLEITVQMYPNDEYNLLDIRPGMWGNIYVNGNLYEDVLCTSAKHDTKNNYSEYKFGAKRNTIYTVTQKYDKKGKLKK